MPVHMWNFFRAVGTGADLKVWNEDNPQVMEKGTIFFQLIIVVLRWKMTEKVATQNLMMM